MDLGVVAHIASLRARLPFLHFFDLYRTSAEIQKIEPIDYSDMKEIFPFDALKEHLHKYALNPQHPTIRGTGQRPDIFFQCAVAGQKYYQEAPGIVEQVIFYFQEYKMMPGKFFEQESIRRNVEGAQIIDYERSCDSDRKEIRAF